MKNIITVFLFLALCSFPSAVISQDVSNFKTTVPKPGNDVRSLFESLIGQGIVLKNYSITRASAADAFGFFEDQGARLGMKKGLLMTSGGVSNLKAANTQPGFTCRNHQSPYATGGKGITENTYPELSRLLTGEPRTYDACVIELDIVPTSDTLSFNYVFGSEEYDEYVGSQYNDVFGFFISGKGISGDKNLAVVPGTKIPVSINTINAGMVNSSKFEGELIHAAAGTGTNPSFYVRNTDGHLAIEYDGLTRLMEIRQPVIPYETYHLKMAIADVSDDALDSGVFIEGQSFISFEKSYNVLFAQNSSELEEGYKTMLNNLLAGYNSRSSKSGEKLLITGHTDADGDPELNNALSEKRAAEVQEYLKAKGVKESDMIVLSRGENMPRESNYTSEGKQLNRRVEIKVCGSLEQYEANKAKELARLKNEASTLQDNYPNPFSTSTTIRAFIQGETREAAVSVSDMKGNLVKVIHVLERGNAEIYFGAEDLPSGVYTAALMADGKTSGTIKMIIQK